MAGYDPIIVLPLLLLVAIFAGYSILGFHALIKVFSLTCEVCGRVFCTDSSMALHMEDHRPRAARLIVEKGNEVSKAA